ASGIVIAKKEAVTSGIGIDQASDCAVFGGDFRLDAAPSGAVARDDDGPLDRDAHAVEFFVVFAIAVVHVHQRGGDVAVGGVGVISRELFGSLIRRGIGGECRFLQLCVEFCGRDEFDAALL